jgi:hypothetical protein
MLNSFEETLVTGEIETRAKNAQWVADFFRDADKLDLPLMMGWFGDEIDLRISNTPHAIGRAVVESVFQNFWADLSGMSHCREELVVDGNKAVQLAVVTYTRKNGSSASLPVASHLRQTADGKLDRLWIYIDIGPLYADAAG